MDSWFEDGSCPVPQVYESEYELIIIYDADGQPMEAPKPKLGFDLTTD